MGEGKWAGHRDGSGSFLGPEGEQLSEMAAILSWKARSRQSAHGPKLVIAWMVRAVGIDSTLVAELDFESSASANFITPAHQTPLR